MMTYDLHLHLEDDLETRSKIGPDDSLIVVKVVRSKSRFSFSRNSSFT